MTGSERQIQERTEIFVAELTELLCQTAFETMSVAIEDAAGAPTRSRPSTLGAVPKRLVSTPFSPRRAKGRKRSKEELEQLTANLGAYIKNNAGQRAEQIARAMGVATRDHVLPVKKLIAVGAISTRGQKRSTQYFPENSYRSA